MKITSKGIVRCMLRITGMGTIKSVMTQLGVQLRVW